MFVRNINYKFILVERNEVFEFGNTIEREMNINTLQDALLRAGVRRDRGITYINSRDDTQVESYAELYTSSKKILGYLRNNGIKKGDKLIFQIQYNYNFINIFWACILGGIIAVPVVINNKSEFMHKVFQVREKLKKSTIICAEERKEKLINFGVEQGYVQEVKELAFIDEESTLAYDGEEGEIVEIAEEDIAFIQFSSGSTGNPKGVVLTHENLVTNIEAIIKGVSMTEEDRIVYWLPLTHDMGIIGCHLSLVYNMGNQYIMPTQLFIYKPILWLEKITEYKSTMMAVSDFGLQFLLSVLRNKNMNLDLSSVRFLLNGAEPISVKVCKEFLNEMKSYGLKETSLFSVYGMAEATLAISFPNLGDGLKYVPIDRENLKVGKKVSIVGESCPNASLYVEEGMPVENVELRICDQNDNIVEDGTFGHIQIKGKSVSKGYYNEEDRAATWTRDQWFKTGDMGFIYDKKVVVVGRDKEMLIINGYNYFSSDLERLAYQISGIRNGKIVVTDVYDRKEGKEKVAVFVVYKKGIEEFCALVNELNTLYRKDLGISVDYIIPITSISKTSSGKIVRYHMKKNFENGEYENVIKEIKQYQNKIKTREKVSKENIEVELVRICREAMQDMYLDKYTNLHDEGINSIAIMKIYQVINEKYEDMLEIEDLFVCNTINDIADKIYENITVDGMERKIF